MPNLLKVAKFGGTSMADATAMRRCAKIVQIDPDKKLIVVSATSGTTNLLTDLFFTLSKDEKQRIIDQIKDKHLRICNDLQESQNVKKELEAILDELEEVAIQKQVRTPKRKDIILSFGERLSSILFAQVLREVTGDDVSLLDAREIIITDNTHGNATPRVDNIEAKAKEKIIQKLHGQRMVTQGFIARSDTGESTTLGRGGSDYSAALFAEAVNADVLEIWTDVTAVYTTDPRITADAKPITEISFDEAAELSVFGAKVLHPATMVPAMRKRIKVYVGSSIEPEKPGTWIVRDTKEKPPIRAISLRPNQTLLTVHSLDMLHRHGFLQKLFGVLAKYKISVDLVTTSEVSVSLTLDTNVNSPVHEMLTDEVLEELRSFCQVEIESGLSLIALVGNDLHATAGLSGPVFGSLKDINVRLICHGASSHNLCFLVKEDSAKDVVRVLHKKFIN